MTNLIKKLKADPERSFLIAFFVTPLFYLIIKIWRSDFTQFESPGLLLSSEYYRKFLWPWFSGWSTQGFGGFPKGYAQPSLFEWLAGGIGKVIGTKASLHLLQTTALILIPISFYFFLTDLGFSLAAIFISFFWGFICLALLPQSYNLDGAIKAAFTGGRPQGFLCLSLIIFYLWSFRRGVKQHRYLLLSSLFFALVALTHFEFGIITFLLSLLYGYLFFIKKNRHKITDYVIHLALVLCLTLIWIGPHFIFRSYLGAPLLFDYKFFTISPDFVFEFLIVWAVLANACFKFKLKWPEPLKIISLIILVTLSEFIFLKAAHLSFGSYLVPLIYIFVCCVVGFLFDQNIRRKVLIVISGCLFAFVAFRTGAFEFQFRHMIAKMKFPIPTNFRGIINEDILSDIVLQVRSPFKIETNFLIHGFDILNGEDPQSSNVSPFVYSFLRELNPGAVIHGNISASLNPNNIYSHALFLGPQWILSNGPLSKESFSHLPITAASNIEMQLSTNDQPTPLIYRQTITTMNNSTAMFLKLAPLATPQRDWNAFINAWWISQDLSRMPIQTDELLTETTPPNIKDTLKLNQVSETKYLLNINSFTPKWVYLKIPYFPNWEGRDLENGNEIPVYRAGPNMMAVNGRGDLDLQFRRSGFEILCHLASLATLLFVIFLFAHESKFKWRRVFRLRP
jgi:hypothetical protein